MAIWALGDLHLSFGVKDKKMDVFGPEWSEHAEKIAQSWKEKISEEDLVLLPGDISWAMDLTSALLDFEWIDSLPGSKVMIRGNHDYWWGSKSKMQNVMPPSLHFIQNDAFEWNGVSIGGCRLWDSPEYNFNDFVIWRENKRENLSKTPPNIEETEKIFLRELSRLEMSLKAMNPSSSCKIVMTHYPPLSAQLEDSRASQLLEKYQIHHCIFGHLHSIDQSKEMFGEKRGIHYHLSSCDYLNFSPLLITKEI